MSVRLVPPSEILTVDGVTLRRWQTSDAPRQYRAIRASLDHLRPWMPWATDDYEEAASRRYLVDCVRKWDAGEDFQYAIVVGAREIVGSIGLMSRLGPGTLEIGYWVDVRHTGQGIATRAAAALSAAGLAVEGIDRIEIRHEPANTASAAVPRRLGFRQVDDVTDDEGAIHAAWRLTGHDLADSRVPDVLGQRRYWPTPST